MNSEQKKRFNEVCKKGNLEPWQKAILKICVEIALDKKINHGATKYILTGKK